MAREKTDVVSERLLPGRTGVRAPTGAPMNAGPPRRPFVCKEGGVGVRGF
jgi:hypothetical protein